MWTAPTRQQGMARQAAAILLRYLAIAVILLALLAVANPHRPDDPSSPASRPWDYQRERIEVEGRGLLNFSARQAMHATAWLAKSSIERQRDVYRLNLLDFLVGDSAAGSLSSWRGNHRMALEAGTELVIIALVGYGVVLRPSRRTWMLALLLLVAGTLLVNKPQAIVRYWVLPVLSCAALLALTSLGSFAVMRLAEALHRSDEYIGLLLAGSMWPLVVAALLVRRSIRRRRAWRPERHLPRGARDER